jgi:hypothetical protein
LTKEKRYAIINIENEREEKHMGRADYKKMARTKFVGQCTFGGLWWVEKVATKKQANKRFRKIKIKD